MRQGDGDGTETYWRGRREHGDLHRGPEPRPGWGLRRGLGLIGWVSLVNRVCRGEAAQSCWNPADWGVQRAASTAESLSSPVVSDTNHYYLFSAAVMITRLEAEVVADAVSVCGVGVVHTAEVVF